MLLDLNIEFLQYCLIDSMSMPKSAKDIKWDGLLWWAEKQAIVGVLFNGIQKAGPALKVPTNILLKWIGYANQIEGQNRLVNQRCVELIEKLAKDGYDSCILKGQGNATYYPEPYIRTPGDIDVWVKPRQEQDGGNNTFVRKTIAYAKSINPSSIASNIHVEYGDFGGVEVEIHYRPAFLHNPFYNRRLTNWVRKQENCVFENSCLLPDGEEICVPTMEFNIVFQLIHMYKHVMLEGLGLRQVIDYYFLLKSNTGLNMNIVPTLRKLGLIKFAGAIMYILQNVLGLEEKYLIVPVEKRRGEFLLGEVLRGGNFGKYDTRKYIVNWNNPVGNWLRHFEHDLRLMRYFPSESLWEAVSRIYLHFWRKRCKPSF